MARQDAAEILAELKELNSRLGRIEQVLQLKTQNISSEISGVPMSERIRDAVTKVLKDQEPGLSFG